MASCIAWLFLKRIIVKIVKKSKDPLFCFIVNYMTREDFFARVFVKICQFFLGVFHNKRKFAIML